MSDSKMTLAFEVNTIEDLADPAAVFEDARRWSTYVGVISDKMAYQVVNYLREQGIYNEDFFSRASKERSLAHIKEQTNTDRHVFISSSKDDEKLADSAGWEFLPLETAAEKADWQLDSTTVKTS